MRRILCTLFAVAVVMPAVAVAGPNYRVANTNDDGELGIEAVQEPAGSGVLRIRGLSIVEGVALR